MLWGVCHVYFHGIQVLLEKRFRLRGNCRPGSGCSSAPSPIPTRCSSLFQLGFGVNRIKTLGRKEETGQGRGGWGRGRDLVLGKNTGLWNYWWGVGYHSVHLKVKKQ